MSYLLHKLPISPSPLSFLPLPCSLANLKELKNQGRPRSSGKVNIFTRSSKVNMSCPKIQFLPQQSQDPYGYYSILMVDHKDFKYQE